MQYETQDGEMVNVGDVVWQVNEDPDTGIFSEVEKIVVQDIGDDDSDFYDDCFSTEIDALAEAKDMIQRGIQDAESSLVTLRVELDQINSRLASLQES